MTEKQLYEFYDGIVKIAYSEIEARENTLPVELLFETNSAFDHLKRYHLGIESESESVGKAYAHLKRGVLDAYKLKLKYFNDSYRELIRRKQDMSFIDNGEFLQRLLVSRKNISLIAKDARLFESRKDDGAFEKWFQVSLMIDAFESEFIISEKLGWSSSVSFRKIAFTFFWGFLSGAASSVLVWFFTSVLPELLRRN